MRLEFGDRDVGEAEVERLQNIHCAVDVVKGSVMNEVAYTESLFAYPAYVAIYNCHISFEYALLDESNREIIYVYFRFFNDTDFLPKPYRPLEFADKEIEYSFDWENQNIYYAPDSLGTHTYYLD